MSPKSTHEVTANGNAMHSQRLTLLRDSRGREVLHVIERSTEVRSWTVCGETRDAPYGYVASHARVATEEEIAAWRMA